MIKKVSGIELLKKNFSKVEEKFQEFFEKGDPRWPTEKHDYLRNHHKTIDNFFVTNITLEKLQFIDLPDPILAEVKVAFSAFENGEEYN
jgi:hypothetical protein